MERPLISYVVTAYNIENYIQESVERAFAQTYSPLEIILSDDGSTDRTFDIMKRMAEEYHGPHKIVLNRNEHNLGITKHMNKAYLELSSGKIIIPAHGDDASDPSRAEMMYQYLSKHPEVSQVSCSAVVVNENGIPYDSYTQRNFHVNQTRTYEFGSGAHVSIGFSAFRREIMDYFGPLDDRCPTEDDPIGFRAILLGKLAFLPDILIKYRKHSGSSSNPELFAQFPLDEIYNQNIRDMELVLKDGGITQEQFEKEKNRLWRSKEIRKVYRRYFSRRTMKSLWDLLKCPLITKRMRLSYLREHVEYLVGHHE